MASHSSALAREFHARRLLVGKRPKRRGRLPRQLEPVGVQREYKAALLVVLKSAREKLQRRLEQHLPGIVRRAGLVRDAIAGIDYAAEISALVEQASAELFAEFPNERLRQLALQYANRTQAFQRAQLAKQTMAALGIDLFKAEPWLQDAMGQFASANVSLIRSIPQQFFQQIEQRLVQGVRSGQTVNELADEVQDRYGVSESRAQLIARDQIGKLYGNVQEARQRDLGIKAYYWRTAQDERVREEHAAREGELFQWTAPPDDGHPGEPIQCRCWAEPDFSDVDSE
jgi:SPP1 gp7 family putative phage head morphogenesis protein